MFNRNRPAPRQPASTWLDRVESELRARKLPRREVARLVTELTDHLSDLAESRLSESPGDPSLPPTARSLISPLSPSLKEDPMSMEANAVATLGSPVEIADTALREFRKRKNLLSRSRLAAFVTFVVLPLPMLVIAWVTCMLATECSLEFVLEGLEWSGVLPAAPADLIDVDPLDFLRDRLRDGAQLEFIAVHLFMIALLSVPAAGVAALYGRLARRTSRRWLWGLTACTLVGLGFGAAQYELRISDRPGKSQLLFGVGIGRPLRQCCYGLLPLAVGVLVLRRSSAVAIRETA